tara:strand:- start:1054 stop:1662 length:609 start_codon:yes stop_codon:yes gene_type:complete
MKFKKIIIFFKRKVIIFLDFLRNKDFLKSVSARELGFNPSENYRYSTNDNYFLKKVLDSMSIKKEDKIIDVGSGKGNVIKLFLKYPFKKIGGLEISKKLISISKKNFKSENQNRLIFYNLDAQEFTNFDEFNIYYFYNPFCEKIFDKVISQIVNKASNKKLLIYNNPTCEESVLNNGFYLIGEFESQFGHGIKLYELKVNKK